MLFSSPEQNFFLKNRPRRTPLAHGVRADLLGWSTPTCLGGHPGLCPLVDHIPFRLASLLLLSVSSDIFNSTLLCGLTDF